MYIEKGLTYCSSCRKRYAVFKRRTSGEKLCRLCLYSSVVRQVRKALHYYKMIRKNCSIMFLLMANSPLLSIAALSIYESAIRDFNAGITVLCFSKYINCKMIRDIMKADRYGVIEVDDEFTTRDFIEWLKYGEYIAIKIARESNIEFIAVPLYRDELSTLSLFGLLTTSRTVFSEGLPIREIDNVKITRPFYYVVSDDVLYLALTDKHVIELDIGKCEFDEKAEFFKHAGIILRTSPELMYSSSKSVEILQSYVFGEVKKCRYCGSYDISDVCHYCAKFKSKIG
ncbi:MAG: hypothetical protein N3D82_03890 [Ignisphaera sp.]|nr:hypothetical protein [Ignisphaera sp.]MCX8168149.1 hypothetical protein [Ignisphaera sp.]MDW8085211.1 hypothetical protein [Ignisphaera sp.]